MKTSKKFHSFKPVGYWELFSQITGKSESDWDDNDRFSNYIHTSVDEFMNQWQMEDDATGMGMSAVEDAVRTAIEDNVNKDVASRRMHAVAYALERALSRVDVPNDAVCNGKKYTITVSVDPEDMVQAWSRAVSGQGYTTWDSSLGIKDISGVKQLANILDELAEVYGYSSLKTLYLGDLSIGEPNVGSYSDLYKVAVKANKAARRGGR